MEVIKRLVEDTNLKKVFDVTIPLPIIDMLVDKRAEEKQKSYRLDGFRVGKAPIEEIKKREAVNLFYSVSDTLINDTINDIVEQNKYKLASQANVDFKQFAVDKNIEIQVTFELIPTIPEIKLNEINIDYYKANVTDEDINRTLDRIVSTYKNWTVKDGVAESGNMTKINFTGYVDGKEFNGGKGENYNLQLGSNTFIGGFEEQLIGSKAGDKVKVKVKFPDTYHSINLAGKDAEFDVEVIEVSEASQVELTDEFIKNTFNVDGLETLKENIKTELLNTYTNISKTKVKNDLVVKLGDSVDFEVPEKALQEKINILTEFKKQDKIDVESIQEDIKKEAIRSLKCGYIFADLAEKNDITVTDSDITEAIMKEAQSMVGNEKLVIDFYRNNTRALEGLRIKTLESKVVDFVIDNVNRNEITISVEEFNKL